jgi:hypothetical protein
MSNLNLNNDKNSMVSDSTIQVILLDNVTKKEINKRCKVVRNEVFNLVFEDSTVYDKSRYSIIAQFL